MCTRKIILGYKQTIHIITRLNFKEIKTRKAVDYVHYCGVTTSVFPSFLLLTILMLILIRQLLVGKKVKIY